MEIRGDPNTPLRPWLKKKHYAVYVNETDRGGTMTPNKQLELTVDPQAGLLPQTTPRPNGSSTRC